MSVSKSRPGIKQSTNLSSVVDSNIECLGGGRGGPMSVFRFRPGIKQSTESSSAAGSRQYVADGGWLVVVVVVVESHSSATPGECASAERERARVRVAAGYVRGSRMARQSASQRKAITMVSIWFFVGTV